jgi:hypothetical protein
MNGAFFTADYLAAVSTLHTAELADGAADFFGINSGGDCQRS